MEISGADQAEYNGQWKVNSVTLSEIRFSMATAPTSNASGSMSVKTASAGWTMSHESADGNRAIFKPANAGSPSLYIDNTDPFAASWGGRTDTEDGSVITEGYNHAALIRGCEGPINSIDDRGLEFGQGGYSLEIANYQSTDTAARAWAIVADHRAFYLHIRDPGANVIDEQSVMFAFGDAVNGPGGLDTSFCILMEIDGTSYPDSMFGNFSDSYCKRLSRGAAGGYRNVPMKWLSRLENSSQKAFALSGLDTKVRLEHETPLLAHNPATGDYNYVGVMPGLAHCLQGAIFDGGEEVDVAGEKYFAFRYAGNGSVNSLAANYMSLVKITGSWR